MLASVSQIHGPIGDDLDLEIVERKGLGHPDTICDEIAEEFSLALSRYYLENFGEILHHNVDKVLLVAGGAQPSFSGGTIVKPMQLILAGRATMHVGGKSVPVSELAQQAGAAWFYGNLPAVDFSRNVKIETVVHPGSADLADLFKRGSGQRVRLANDTSCGVGYAPLSRLEKIVGAVEQELGVAAVRSHHAFGRDIKVMGTRRGDQVHLTIACGIVGKFVPDIATYLQEKEAVAHIARTVAERHGASRTTADVNVGDDVDQGSVYLTVSGTSAEAGDDGQTGRGNRVNGLITPYRPMTMESVAGKNPITHVGKLYNIVAGLIAEAIIEALPDILAAEVYLVSSIGRPIERPAAVDIRIAPRSGHDRREFEEDINSICQDYLARLDTLWSDLLNGIIRVGRWPLTNVPTKRS